MRYIVQFEHITGWSTGFEADTDETPAVLLKRLSLQGVVLDKAFETAYYAPSQIKSMRIVKDE